MRIKDNRYDIFCCIKKTERKPVRDDIVRKYFNDYYVPFVF